MIYSIIYEWTEANIMFTLICALVANLCLACFLRLTGKCKNEKTIRRVIAFFYGVSLFGMTIGFKERHSPELWDLYFYKEYAIADFDGYLTWEMCANVMMFMPFGMLLWKRDTSRISIWLTLVCGSFVSLGIELLQFATNRGYMDLEDVLCNAWGTVGGWILMSLVTWISDKYVTSNDTI